MTGSDISLPATGFIAISQLLQAGVVGAYTSNLSEVDCKWMQTGGQCSFALVPQTIELTRGTTKLTAGYTSSIGQVSYSVAADACRTKPNITVLQIIPIVLTPLVGLCFDLFGRRMWFVSATAGERQCILIQQHKLIESPHSSLGSGVLAVGVHKRAPARSVGIRAEKAAVAFATLTRDFPRAKV